MAKIAFKLDDSMKPFLNLNDTGLNYQLQQLASFI